MISLSIKIRYWPTTTLIQLTNYFDWYGSMDQIKAVTTTIEEKKILEYLFNSHTHA